MIAAIIQARTGSTRLPKKVIMDIEGKPMLWHVVNRVKQAKKIDEVIIATSNKQENQPIIKLAQEIGVKSYVGSEDDVLDRYYQAAKLYGADVVVRVTGDCPLIDPEIIDKAVEYFLNSDFDYVSTAHISQGELSSTYPDGLDTEVFSFTALEKAWKEAKINSEREHVTPYIWKNPQLFKIKDLKNDKDLSYMRWTVDEECDLRFIREIYKKLYPIKKMFYMEDILNLLKKEPELLKINRGIIRDEGYFKSLKEDKKANYG